MHRILLPILVLPLLVAIASVGCSDAPGVTVLRVAEGSVCVIRGGTGDCTEVQPNTKLRPGDIIKTDDASSAQITFFDGTTVDLEAGTEIEVESLEVTGTGSTIIVLKQTIGSITFRVTKIIDPGSTYDVETPTGVASVRGSAVDVDVSEDGTTWITNLEGEIWASAQGVELQIPVGQRCIIRPGQPPILSKEVGQYALKIGNISGGSVAVPGRGTFTYDEGTVVSLQALPNKGYRFVNWTGNVDTIADVNAASTTITMNNNYAITANFEEAVQYELKIGSTSGGSVATPGEGILTYDEGTVVNLQALPTKDYRFVNWTGNVGTIEDVNAAITTITMNNNYAITANFEEAVQYDLKIGSTSGGSVATPGEGIFTYEKGTVVTLQALPTKDYRFVNWTGNVGTIANVNAASTTITMNNNYAITANFEEIVQYDLKIGSTSGGSVATPGEGIFTYEKGTVVTLQALPAKGYRFVNWTGNVGTIADVNAAITTITMNNNYAITANFEEDDE